MDEQALLITIRRYEQKLQELMLEDDFKAFIKEVAKEVFFADCTNLPEGDFKEFCLDNFSVITSDDDFWKKCWKEIMGE